MDLQNVDLKYYEKAYNLDKKLNGLKCDTLHIVPIQLCEEEEKFLI